MIPQVTLGTTWGCGGPGVKIGSGRNRHALGAPTRATQPGQHATGAPRDMRSGQAPHACSPPTIPPVNARTCMVESAWSPLRNSLARLWRAPAEHRRNMCATCFPSMFALSVTNEYVHAPTACRKCIPGVRVPSACQDCMPRVRAPSLCGCFGPFPPFTSQLRCAMAASGGQPLSGHHVGQSATGPVRRPRGVYLATKSQRRPGTNAPRPPLRFARPHQR